MANITPIAKNAIDIQHKSKDYPEVTLFVKALAPPKPVDVSKWDECDKVNPFFLVKDTTDKKQANVCFKMVKQDGVSFSILTNQKKIDKHSQLFVFKADTPKAALEHCEAVEVAPPKRRRLRGKTEAAS